MSFAARTASLIGAPTDVGASDRGASMGPEALRVAGIHAALTQRGLDVVDCGNVGGPPNPGLIKVNGYRNLAQVTAWNLEVHDAVVVGQIVSGGLYSVGAIPGAQDLVDDANRSGRTKLRIAILGIDGQVVLDLLQMLRESREFGALLVISQVHKCFERGLVTE